MHRFFSVLSMGLIVAATVACSPGDAGPRVEAGAAVVDVTPDFEPYTDSDGDGDWDAGEPFADADGDGELDSLWLGGFGARRPTGVHDRLEARSLAIRIDGRLWVLTAVDALGLSLGRIAAIRRAALARLPAGQAPPIEQLMVASTHSHSTPDSIGVFAPGSLEPGWDAAYLDALQQGAADSIVAAVEALEPAELVVATAEAGEGFVRDLDPPAILDPVVGILQLRRPDGSGLATAVSIANHPEAVWRDNTLISADYPGVLRAELEARFGGTGLFFAGALGLMQSPAELDERDFARAERLAEMYAERVAAALDEAAPLRGAALRPRFAAAEVPCCLQNLELLLAIEAGVVEGYAEALYDDGPGGCAQQLVDLPISALRLGDAWTLVTLPGELTPELIRGGIVAPAGYAGPYPDAPAEPHLEQALGTEHRFLLGLAQAEVGYIYPKRTYWPEEVFGQRHGPGPDVAMSLMNALVELLDGLAAPG